MDSKHCAKCKTKLPLIEFSFQKGSNRYNTWCKACIAHAARIRLQKQRGNVDNAQQRRERAQRAELSQFVVEYLKFHPCVVCGENDPVVLDFDHITGVKVASVTRMVSVRYSKKRILEEIAKCQVLCSNCHRRKTAQAQGWLRAAL